MELVDLTAEGADCAIRYGGGCYCKGRMKIGPSAFPVHRNSWSAAT